MEGERESAQAKVAHVPEVGGQEKEVGAKYVSRSEGDVVACRSARQHVLRGEDRGYTATGRRKQQVDEQADAKVGG